MILLARVCMIYLHMMSYTVVIFHSLFCLILLIEVIRAKLTF